MGLGYALRGASATARPRLPSGRPSASTGLVEAYRGIGNALASAGQHREAEAAFREAFRLGFAQRNKTLRTYVV